MVVVVVIIVGIIFQTIRSLLFLHYYCIEVYEFEQSGGRVWIVFLACMLGGA